MGAILSVETPNSNVGLSSSFAVDISVKDVTDLNAFQFDLKFNPSLFNAVSVNEGSFYAGENTYFQQGTIDNANGEITFVANTLLGPATKVSQQGVLASISFQSLTQAGLGNFSLQNTILLDSGGLDISHTASSVNVSVGAVPEPEEWVMMLVGAGMIGFQLKRRKSQSED